MEDTEIQQSQDTRDDIEYVLWRARDIAAQHGLPQLAEEIEKGWYAISKGATVEDGEFKIVEDATV